MIGYIKGIHTSVLVLDKLCKAQKLKWKKSGLDIEHERYLSFVEAKKVVEKLQKEAQDELVKKI